ncbi:MAG: hypothetical protein ACRDA4_10685 [Filifactoraceae bacterium]
MKILAEFNSNEEILDFVGLFKGDTPTDFPKFNIEPKKETKKIVKVREDGKVVAKEVNEEVKADDPKEETVVTEDKKKDEELKITKEFVRSKFIELSKLGRSSEAKEVLGRYGVKKVTEVKEEDYVAIVKDVEALL